jgi:hypothetical protein
VRGVAALRIPLMIQVAISSPMISRIMIAFNPTAIPSMSPDSSTRHGRPMQIPTAAARAVERISAMWAVASNRTTLK